MPPTVDGRVACTLEIIATYVVGGRVCCVNDVLQLSDPRMTLVMASESTGWRSHHSRDACCGIHHRSATFEFSVPVLYIYRNSFIAL